MEWGCMQALIDFDGWRKWKDFSSLQAKDSAAKHAGAGAGAQGPNGKLAAPLGTGGANKRERAEKRASAVGVGDGVEGKVIAAGA